MALFTFPKSTFLILGVSLVWVASLSFAATASSIGADVIEHAARNRRRSRRRRPPFASADRARGDRRVATGLFERRHGGAALARGAHAGDRAPRFPGRRRQPRRSRSASPAHDPAGLAQRQRSVRRLARWSARSRLRARGRARLER